MGALDLPVARWGNGLAVRISAQMARELNVTEGSVIQAEVVGPAQLRLASGQAFLARLDRLHERMGMTEPVVEKMRGDDRY
jgi:antitoxin component of MazEF toxin-antitoxin module